jgi:peptidase C39-like protein
MIEFAIHLLIALLSLTFAFLMRKKAENSKRYKITAYIVSILCVLPIAVKGIFVFFPVVEVYLMPASLYHYIDRTFPFLFLLIFLSVISTIAKKREKRLIYLLMIIFSIYTVNMTTWRFTTPACYSFDGKIKDGVCIQTSGYTCGAASMVTFLKNMNTDATEGEMARFSGTIPFKGVSNFQTAAGMNRKFKKEALPYKMVLKTYTNDELMEIQTPFLVTIKHAFFCDHMVCVLYIEENEVILGDPLTGKRSISTKEFLSLWKNVVIEAKLNKHD